MELEPQKMQSRFQEFSEKNGDKYEQRQKDINKAQSMCMLFQKF